MAKHFVLAVPESPEYGSKLKYGNPIQVTEREPSFLPSDIRGSKRSVGARYRAYFPSDVWTVVLKSRLMAPTMFWSPVVSVLERPGMDAICA